MKRFAVLVAVFTSACVGEIGGTDSSPTNDPPHDPPPPPTEVRVAVHDSTGPIAGLAVVFLNPDDSEVADIVTDAQGVATAKLPMGGSVSVIRDDTTGTDPAGAAYTYVGVKGGDQLDLALPALSTTNPTTVTVQVPDPDPDARVPVEVRTPCGSGQGLPPQISVTLDGCGAMTDF